MYVCVICSPCTCARARARSEVAHGILCIQARSLVRPWCASARALAHSPAHTHSHTQLQVLCAVQSGRGRERSGAISSYPRCSHICPRALRRVCTCVCDTRSDPLPLRHLPPPLSAEPPPTLARGRAASLLEKPRGAERGPGHPIRGCRTLRTRGGTSWWDAELGHTQGRYSAALRKGEIKPLAALAFRRNGRLAPGQLAAGGKGRGPARPLTHPVRAGRRGPGSARGGTGGNSFRGVRAKGGPKM